MRRRLRGRAGRRDAQRQHAMTPCLAVLAAGDKMVTPLVKVKSLHKYTKRFKRHQCDRRMTVGVSRAARDRSG